MAQVGRISGPLLEANLERNGIDLAFRNDLDTTQLLYLDVNNNRIGVNNGTPTHDLTVDGTIRTTNIIANGDRVSGFDINNSTLSAIGNIQLSASEAILTPAIDNGTIFIDGNYIATTITNANIDITPNGTGETNVVNDLNVYGDLYTSGNITLDGSITFGNESADTVDFNADVDSDIIPDQTGIYNLGSFTKRWNTLYTDLINGQTVSADDLTVGGIDFKTSQGNIIYVAQRGTDTNRGDHILAPVASIKRALELVDASIGAPTAIYIFPGDYEEETPLVVPSNVSIIGADIRNVNIFPTSYTLSEDVFHLNGETTVQNLTIKNFYYDSINNTGYAFRFAPNAVISSRSPYIQNVTVITQGSATSVDDPRGFDAGDAGKGAWIDGAEMNSASFDASMLFHSCTFITPGVDTITMTNGVRVEWLNSFTYYANRGLYAVNGVTGRTSQDGSTVTYGAEIRSIGSANVYGNYGAEADGADCLMYLIQHNFAYIGSGKDSSNDNGLVIQANEVVEINSGQIHYVTTDHTGAFRVGDNFFIDFETGNTSVDLSTLAADSLTGLVINTGNSRTIITGENIETGNIRFSANLIESLSDGINLNTATGEINLNNDTNISNNLNIAGNLTFGGNLNLLGNQTSDTLKFNVDFDQDFLPNQTLRYDLGSANKLWSSAYLTRANLDTVQIYDNVIETTVSNADLDLRASGTGNVRFKNNTTINNNLTTVGIFVSESSSIINGDFTQFGDVIETGSGTISGNLTIGNSLSVEKAVALEEILIDDNVITTISSNADLELRATGTGTINTSNQLEVGNDLLSPSINVLSNFSVVTDTTFNVATISSIKIENNSITTTVSNADLELRAPGSSLFSGGSSTDISELILTGGSSTTTIFDSILDGGGSLINLGESEPVVRLQKSSIFDQSLTVNGLTQLNDIVISGFVSHSGQRQLEGNYLINGEILVDDVIIEDNFISTINSNSDLELRAAGTGKVLIPDNDVKINNDLTLNGNTSIQDVDINGLLTHIGQRTQAGNYNHAGDLTLSGQLVTDSRAQFENVIIDGNTITSSLPDLELISAGSGSVLVPNNNVQVNNDLFAASITAGNIIVDADLLLNEIVIPPSIIEIDDNFISTKVSNANLELRANGTGNISVQTSNIQIDTELTVSGTTNLRNINITKSLLHTGNRTQTGNYNQTGNLVVNGIFTAESEVQFENINIDDNIITATASNSDLELRAAGTSNIRFENLQINNSISAANAFANDITVNTDILLNEIVIPPSIIEIDDNFISTRVSNADLDLRANGTGQLIFKNNAQLDQKLTASTATLNNTLLVLGTLTQTGDRTQQGTLFLSGSPTVTGLSYFNSLTQFENIQIDGNYIGTTLSSSDFELRANGSGKLLISSDVEVSQNISAANLTSNAISIAGNLALESFESSTDIQIFDNVITTTNSNSDLELRANGTGNISLQGINVRNNQIDTIGANITFAAPNLNIESTGALKIPTGTAPLTLQGSIKFDTTTGLFEGRKSQTIPLTGVYSQDRRTRVLAHPTNNTIDLTVNNASVGTMSATGLLIHEVKAGDISLQSNEIATNTANSNLLLTAPGTGAIAINDIRLTDNVIENSGLGELTFNTTGFGRLKFSGAALAIPNGTTAERPVSPPIGDTRWNTTTSILETWDGNQYISAAGISEAISEAEFNDLLLEYTLIFG